MYSILYLAFSVIFLINWFIDVFIYDFNKMKWNCYSKWTIFMIFHEHIKAELQILIIDWIIFVDTRW